MEAACDGYQEDSSHVQDKIPVKQDEIQDTQEKVSEKPAEILEKQEESISEEQEWEILEKQEESISEEQEWETADKPGVVPEKQTEEIANKQEEAPEKHIEEIQDKQEEFTENKTEEIPDKHEEIPDEQQNSSESVKEQAPQTNRDHEYEETKPQVETVNELQQNTETASNCDETKIENLPGIKQVNTPQISKNSFDEPETRSRKLAAPEEDNNQTVQGNDQPTDPKCEANKFRQKLRGNTKNLLKMFENQQ